MKKSLLLPAGFALLLSVAPAAALPINHNSTLFDVFTPQPVKPPVHFAGGIEDLPLMPGLEDVEGDDVNFTTPHGGRIAESNARGEVDVDDVYKFYRNALPQLGWKRADNRDYARKGEHLHIEARADGKVTTVSFSVKPEAEK